MRRSLLFGVFVVSMILLLYGCIANYGKMHIVVSINPPEIYEGQAATLTLDTIPNNESAGVLGGEIILDGKIVKTGEKLPLSFTTFPSSGTHKVCGKVITNLGEESTTVTFNVKPASKKYRVFLEVEKNEVNLGQTVNITVNLNELPEASWYIVLHIDNSLEKPYFSVPFVYEWEPEKPGTYTVYAVLKVKESKIKSNECEVEVLNSTSTSVDHITSAQ